MKLDLKLVLLLAFAVTTGALGALLFQSRQAQAQAPSHAPAHYRECVAMWISNHFSRAGEPGHLENPEGRFPIPPGWTPVGGGGPTHSATVILCR